MRAIRFDDKLEREKNPDGTWIDKLTHIREVSYFILFQSFIGFRNFHAKYQKCL